MSLGALEELLRDLDVQLRRRAWHARAASQRARGHVLIDPEVAVDRLGIQLVDVLAELLSSCGGLLQQLVGQADTDTRHDA
jgi:hypothetical protein